jgi:TonB family protein
MLTFAQKAPVIDTVRAPLAYVYNLDQLLITLWQDSTIYKVKLGGDPKDVIPAVCALDLRRGDTLTLCGERNPKKKIKTKDQHMLSARILSVDYAKDHDDQPCYLFSMDQQPTFQGRKYNSFSQWVNTKLVYPESSKRAGSEGTVRLTFIIDRDGEVQDIGVVDSSGDRALDAEAIRVVYSSPKWQPGMLNGKPVKTRFTFPVVFMLQNRKTSAGR